MASYRSSNGPILEALANRMGTLSHQASEMGQRGTWPITRVFKVNPSPDGVVRSVWIWINKTELHRPVVDLCLIETEEEEEVEIPLVMLSSVPTRPGPAMLRISRLFEFVPRHVTLIPLPLQSLCLLPEACLGLAGGKLRVKRLVVV